MGYLIGADIGTTGTKTLLCDESGAVLGAATVEFPLHQPRPLWSEQDPEDWWRATCESIRRAIAAAGVW